MTVKTANFRGDIYKNDKNAELRCSPEPIQWHEACWIVHFTNEIMIPKMSYVTFHWLWLWSMSTSSIFGKLFSFSQTVYKWTLWILLKSVLRLSMTPQFWLNLRHLHKPHLWPKITRQLLFYLWFPQLLPHWDKGRFFVRKIVKKSSDLISFL